MTPPSALGPVGARPDVGGDGHPPVGPTPGGELVPLPRRRHGAEDDEDDPVPLSPAALGAGLRASVSWRDVLAALVLAVAVTVIEVALIVTLIVSGGPETTSLARSRTPRSSLR